jgi:N-acetylneuraminic acid mutarotase
MTIMKPARRVRRGPPVLRTFFVCSAAAIGLVLLPGARAAAGQTSAGSWETLPEAEQPQQRHESGYVKVGDRLYLLGGRGERAVQSFDPVGGGWTNGAVPPIEMHHFQAVAFGGKIYVIGALTGRYPTEPPIPHIYIYDPSLDSWTRGPEIPADRRRGAAGAIVHDGRIYLVAGIQNGHTDGHVSWFDSFDPETGEWARLPDAPRARDHFQIAVVDDRLYAIGGRRSSAGTGQTFDLTVAEVDVYDFATGGWTTLPAAANLPTLRAGTTSVVVDGEILVIGGESGGRDDAHAEVEAFGPATGTWRSLAPLNQGRHATQGVVHDGKIYIAAGSRTRGATEINSQEVYTPGR